MTYFDKRKHEEPTFKEKLEEKFEKFGTWNTKEILFRISISNKMNVFENEVVCRFHLVLDSGSIKLFSNVEGEMLLSLLQINENDSRGQIMDDFSILLHL